MKTLTLEQVLARAIKTPNLNLRGRPNKCATFIADGHVVPETNVVWYQENDGTKYGFISDQRLCESLCHHGFQPVKIR